MTYCSPADLPDTDRVPFDVRVEYLTAETLFRALQAEGMTGDAEIHLVVNGQPVSASRVYVQRIPGSVTVLAITNDPLQHDSRCDRDLCHSDCPIRKAKRESR